MNSQLFKILLIMVLMMGIFNNKVHGQLEVKPIPDDSLATEIDRHYIRKTYQIAKDAGEKNYPYGALLVKEGKIIGEYGNKINETGDVTMHAETGLISHVSKAFDAQIFSGTTLYTSTEPCIMCSGAIYWAGIKKIVYGTSELSARLLFDPDAQKKLISCREVFKRINPNVKIMGPVLEKEGLEIHRYFE